MSTHAERFLSVKDAFNINDMILHVFQTYPHYEKEGGCYYTASNRSEFYVGYNDGQYEISFGYEPYLSLKYDHAQRTIDLEDMELTLSFCVGVKHKRSIISTIIFPIVYADREELKDWIP